MAYYRGVARDEYGNSLNEASVSVFAPGTTTLSTIYSEETLTTALENPFATGTDGVYELYATPDYYDIQVAKSGFSTVTLSNQVIGSVFGNFSGAVPANDTVPSASQIQVDSGFGSGPWSFVYGGGFTGTGGNFQYTGLPTIQAHTFVSMAIGQAAVASRDFQFYLIRDFDGSPETLAYSRITCPQDEYVNISIAAIVPDLKTDDEISVTVTAITSDTVLYVHSGDWVIRGLG